MLLGLFRARGRITLSGALTTTSASSPVTSASRTITGSGRLKFTTVFTDSGAPEYSYAAGAWTTITEGLEISVTNGNTIAVRASLPTVLDMASFGLYGNNKLVEAVVLTKS